MPQAPTEILSVLKILRAKMAELQNASFEDEELSEFRVDPADLEDDGDAAI